jgi:hypothetical protein
MLFNTSVVRRILKEWPFTLISSQKVVAQSKVKIHYSQVEDSGIAFSLCLQKDPSSFLSKTLGDCWCSLRTFAVSPSTGAERPSDPALSLPVFSVSPNVKPHVTNC